MNKVNLFLILLIIFTNCSFDNKTGIWTDDSVIKEKVEKEIKAKQSKLKSVFSGTQIFSEEKSVDLNSNIQIKNSKKNNDWLDHYFNLSNNVTNISYENKGDIISKSPKLSRSLISSSFLFYKNNIISYDNKGTIYIYSIPKRTKIFEYNFYKNQFKKYKKEIFLTIENNFIIASDNLGYIYSININSGKLNWAKNFGIPFRSNIKVLNSQIFLANQDNIIYSVRTSDGEKNWQFPTSETFIKNEFKNSIAIDQKKNSLYFFNTSGELYSINYINKKINWVLNLRNTSASDRSELFSSLPLVIDDNNILVVNNNLLQNYESFTGSKKWSYPYGASLKPVLNNNYVFILNKNNLLICLELNTGTVLWSKKIYKQIQTVKPKKIGIIQNIIVANSRVLLHSSNGYLLSFNYKNGDLISLKRITKSFLEKGNPIFVNGYMYAFDKNYKLYQIN